jgi:hypothetical protein
MVETDYNYINRVEKYIDQLEEDVNRVEGQAVSLSDDLMTAKEELADWKEHIFDDPDMFYEDGHGNLFEITEDDIVMLLEEDDEEDVDDVFTPEPADEARNTRSTVMNFILDKMNADFATLRELVDDEST